MKIFWLFVVLTFTFPIISCTQNGAEVKKSRRETFLIDNGKDTLIVGQQGTRIEISKNSFISADGKKLDSILLFLEEYYDISDMILSGLSTTTKDSLLSTSGMVYIDILNKSDSIILRDSSEFRVVMRKNKEDKDTYFPFIGELIKNGNTQSIIWRKSDSLFLDTKFIRTERGNDVYITRDTSNSFFTSRKLGWINSDKFINYNDTHDLVVTSENEEAFEVFALLTNEKSIIKGTVDGLGNQIILSIPKEYETYIVAVVNKIPLYYDIQRVADDDTVIVKLKRGTMINFKKEIDQILE